MITNDKAATKKITADLSSMLARPSARLDTKAKSKENIAKSAKGCLFAISYILLEIFI
jgi:hypothetical protein